MRERLGIGIVPRQHRDKPGGRFHIVQPGGALPSIVRPGNVYPGIVRRAVACKYGHDIPGKKGRILF